MIYPDTTDPAQKAWAEAYKKRYGKTHTGAGQLGYAGGETFVEVLKRAGRNLTTDSFIKAAESLKGYSPSLGGPPLTFGPKDHHGLQRGEPGHRREQPLEEPDETALLLENLPDRQRF